MIIKIRDIEYSFKDEPTSRDLLKIGLQPAYHGNVQKYIRTYIKKITAGKSKEEVDQLQKDGHLSISYLSQNNVDFEIPEVSKEDYNELLEYNGKILNTLYTGTTKLYKGDDIEDWMDVPQTILKAVMSHPKFIELMGKLYG